MKERRKEGKKGRRKKKKERRKEGKNERKKEKNKFNVFEGWGEVEKGRTRGARGGSQA